MTEEKRPAGYAPEHAKKPPTWFVIGFSVFIAVAVGGCLYGCLGVML